MYLRVEIFGRCGYDIEGIIMVYDLLRLGDCFVIGDDYFGIFLILLLIYLIILEELFKLFLNFINKME